MGTNKNYKRSGGNGPITRNKEKFIAQKGLCYYCDSEMYVHTEVPESHTRRATREHLQIRAKGGKGGNNIVLACHGCNTRRRDKPLEEFLKIMETLWVAEIDYKGNKTGYGKENHNIRQVFVFFGYADPQAEELAIGGSKETSGLQSETSQMVREDSRA